MGLEELDLVSKLTKDLTDRKQKFKLSFSTLDGFTFEFQNFVLEGDKSCDSRESVENWKVCKVTPTKQLEDANLSLMVKHPIFVTQPGITEKHFAGKTLAEVEAECNREDICWRITNICLELFGRGTYSV